MGYLKIRCHYCGGTWEAYRQMIDSGDYASTCPHCFKSIERQTWEKQIVPAFHALDDANRELLKDYTGYHVPLFEVSYKADTVSKNGYENCLNIN